ncbi:hypothetical protein HMI54_001627, partial [Coelomomyces lativittatus]
MAHRSMQGLPHLNLMGRSQDASLDMIHETQALTNSLFLQHLHKKIINAGHHIFDGIQNLSLSTPPSQQMVKSISAEAMELVRLGESLFYMEEFNKNGEPTSSSQPFDLMEVLQNSIENLSELFQQGKCEVSLHPCTTTYCMGDPELIGSIFEILLSAFATDSPTSCGLHVEMELRKSLTKLHYKIVFKKPHSAILIQRLAVPISVQLYILKNLVRFVGALLYPLAKDQIVLECTFEVSERPTSGNLTSLRNFNSAEKSTTDTHALNSVSLNEGRK